jgi:hypothetical protein
MTNHYLNAACVHYMAIALERNLPITLASALNMYRQN